MSREEILKNLLQEIITTRKQFMKIIQTFVLIVVGMTVMFVISLSLDDSDLSWVLNAIIVCIGIYVYKKLPFGKVQIPDEDEVLEYAREKHYKLSSREQKITTEIQNLNQLLLGLGNSFYFVCWLICWIYCSAFSTNLPLLMGERTILVF